MQIFKKITVLALMVASTSALSSCAPFQSIGKINVVPTSLGALKVKQEGALPVALKAYLTGWVLAPADVLIDQANPETPLDYREAKWVPSIAYAVTHPKLGTVILDTGLRAGDCSYGQRPIYWVECENSVGSDLVSQLKKDRLSGDDIRFIVPSHFHGDHISGLSDLLAYGNKPLLITNASLSEIESMWRFASGIPSEMLGSDMDVELLDNSWTEDTLLGRYADVFGDGSVKLFETTGHSEGHLSALIRTEEGTTLLTFDAAHLAVNYRLNIPSGSATSLSAAQSSIESLKKIDSSFGDVQIIFGHEPTQWDCEKPAVNLALCAPPPSKDIKK